MPGYKAVSSARPPGETPTCDPRGHRSLPSWVPLVWCVGLCACSTRSVPDRWPRTAAASPEAPEPSPAPGPAALAGDPPLPGESVGAWHGLAPTPSPDGGAPAMPPDHQHMHHGGKHAR
ncbi:MAG: hypothetical protein HY909_22840 [Deltaproteobacteria bacterium]|nr:hypothetical protein [Deltaproteobacteria bacterium]